MSSNNAGASAELIKSAAQLSALLGYPLEDGDSAYSFAPLQAGSATASHPLSAGGPIAGMQSVESSLFQITPVLHLSQSQQLPPGSSSLPMDDPFQPSHISTFALPYPHNTIMSPKQSHSSTCKPDPAMIASYDSAIAAYEKSAYRAAQSDARIAELDRAIAAEKERFATEMEKLRTRESHLVARILLRRKQISATVRSGYAWRINGVDIKTSLPPQMRGYLGPKHSYQSFLDSMSESKVTSIEPRRIWSMPAPFATMFHLPPELREIRSGKNVSLAFENDWLIVRNHHALVVSTDERVLALVRRMHGGGDAGESRTLEVMGKRWGEPQYMYFGSFKPASWWLPFTQAVTGEIPELFQGWSKSAADGGRVKFEHLRAHWPYAGNGLVFCVLEFVEFNHAYFGKLVAQTSAIEV